MKVIDDRVNMRRLNHDYYFRELKGTWLNTETHHPIQDLELNTETSSSGIYFLKEPDNCFSNRWLSTILVNPKETGGITRDNIRLALEDENIESRPLWKPMHLQPLYKDFPYYGRGISDKVFRYGLCLPSGSNLTDKDRLRIVSAIKEVMRPSSRRLSKSSAHL